MYAREDAASRIAVKRLSNEIDELRSKEEIKWRQRSRISWLREGDRNTKKNSPQGYVASKKKKNKIEKLQVSSGDVITDVQEMENLATDYFKDLYTVDPAVQPEFITGFLQQKIDDPMNEALCANFTD